MDYSKPVKQGWMPGRKVALSIGFYALCSSSMLFLNKLSVSMADTSSQEAILQPGAISCIQVGFTIAVCAGLYASGMQAFEGITGVIIWQYFIYSFLFVGSVYTSMKALKQSNVETAIIFRSATPIVVAVLDFVFLGRELPSTKSTLALLSILGGVLIYVSSDSDFVVNGFSAYTWVTLYFILICIQMTLGKRIMSVHKLDSIWSSVLLTNVLAMPMLFALSNAQGEFEGFWEAVEETSPRAWGAILMGSVVGTLIGWAGWQCRNLVSATSYTLIGVVNKLLTVVLSVLFLDKHASFAGGLALCICIGAATQYSQAPLRGVSQGLSAPSAGNGGKPERYEDLESLLEMEKGDDTK